MSATPFVRHSRLPLFRPGDESVVEGESSADAFLRLACLNYGADHPSRRDQAREVFAGHPEIRGSNVFVAAAMGDAAALKGILQRNPESAGAKGGPFGWEPLLYLAYSRCGFSEAWHDPVASARLLLQHGADPNAGFLWDGICLFTALTGVFGEGEAGPVNQPAHSHEDSLARMLLAAGADPNDGQALYNRQFTRGSSHLRLLLDHGLGTASRGPGNEREGVPKPSPEDLLLGQLFWAAEHGHGDRVELLAACGIDLNARSSLGRTASELAALNDHRDIVRLLEQHGADPVSLSPAGQLEAACQAGRRGEARALLEARPDLLAELAPRRAGMLVAAARDNRLDAARLMLELGFPVNIPDAPTALHQAAWFGHLAMARLLVEAGADRNLRDPGHHARPVDWARYNQKTAVAEYLEAMDRGETNPAIEP